MKYIFSTLFFICSLLQVRAQAFATYEIGTTFESVNSEGEGFNDLYTYTQLLVDPTEAWTYEEVLQKDEAFAENTTRKDWDIEKVYWLKFQLRSAKAQRTLFSAGYLFGDYAKVEIYYENQDSLIIQRAGSRRKAAEKAIRRMGSYFWVDIPADTIKTVYLRIDNANWPCDCWDRNPISIYHIDASSIFSLRATYILQDFAKEGTVSTTWEPGRIAITPSDTVKPYIWWWKTPRLASLARYFEFYPDPTCSQSLSEVRTNWDEQAFFRYFQGPEFTTDTCYWARLTLYNPKPFSQIRTFAYWDYKWENIEYYLPDQLGNYTRFQAKPVESNQEAFTFSVPAKDTLTLYIRYPLSYQMQSANGSIVDIPKGELDQQAELGHLKFFLAGGMFLFIIYFFFQLIVGRQRIVFHYFFMLIGFFPFLLLSLDLTYLFVFTKTLIMHRSVFSMSWVIILASLLAMVGFLNFTQVSLNLKLYFPKYVTLMNVLIVVKLCLAILGAILLFYLFKFEKANDTFIKLHMQIQSISGLYHASATFLIVCIALHAFAQKVPLSGSFLLATLPVGLATIHASIAQVFHFTFNLSFLPFIIGMLLTLILFGVFVASKTNLQKQEEHKAIQQKITLENELLQIESKALRAQMNPHFIFNCLNSIKSLIQEEANKKAIHYLTLFSKFIRNVLHYSEEKQITLEEELQLSKTYLEMEKLRFEKSFSYSLQIAPNVDTSFIKVPPMILQPFLENAIWHGLLHKDGERELKLAVQGEEGSIVCIIEDNGIGREQAKVLQLNTQKQHRSFGTQLTQDRLQVNNRLFNSKYLVNIIDKMGNDKVGGTRVELHFNSH